MAPDPDEATQGGAVTAIGEKDIGQQTERERREDRPPTTRDRRSARTAHRRTGRAGGAEQVTQAALTAREATARWLVDPVWPLAADRFRTADGIRSVLSVVGTRCQVRSGIRRAWDRRICSAAFGEQVLGADLAVAVGVLGDHVEAGCGESRQQGVAARLAACRLAREPGRWGRR